MIRWLRRQAANYSNITRHLYEVEAARRERDEANARTVAAVLVAAEAVRAAEIAYRQADGARALMGSLLEPGPGEGCVKVRLRDRDEAEAFAARVLNQTGEDCYAYRCPKCPRQPVSCEKFWHIATADPERRGKPHRHQKRMLRHVPPETWDALRARVAGEAS
jgi:hypothetical protein